MLRTKFGIEISGSEEFVIGRENRQLNVTDKKVSRRQATVALYNGTGV